MTWKVCYHGKNVVKGKRCDDGRHVREGRHNDDYDVGDGVDDDVVWELVVQWCRRVALVGATVPVGRRNGRRRGKGAGGAFSCSTLQQMGFGALCGHGRPLGGTQGREGYASIGAGSVV